MRQSLFLCLTFLFIFTCFLYIQSSQFSKQIFNGLPDELSQYILIGVECFTLLFGGLVATFVIAPINLFIISLLCLLIGVVIFETFTYCCNGEIKCDYKNRVTIFYTGLVLFGVFYALFRFIILVMMLNQADTMSIKQKSQEWFMVLNICYMIVWVFLPVPLKTNDYITICIPLLVIGLGLLILGLKWNYYEIYSKPINIKSVIGIFKKPVQNPSVLEDKEDNEILPESTEQILNIKDSEKEESKNILLNLSKSIIIFILFLPYGICDSQNHSTYMYQSNQMRQPKLDFYFNGRSNMWPVFFSTLTVICFLVILWCLRRLSPGLYNLIYPKNIKYRIIFGNLLMIYSTLMNGALETWRLEVFWGFNHTTMIPSSKSLNQTIDGELFAAADLSVFYMVPQIVMIGMSEVYFLLSGIEIMDRLSMKNMKYLSISLLMAAIGNGGLSDFFFISIGSFNIFNPLNLNERRQNQSGLCCSYESRLDYVLYGLAVLAFLSLVISIILMMKFPNAFARNPSSSESQDSEENIY